MRRKPSLKAGDIFQNQYEILGVLGAGGHAFVYRVYNQILGYEQALKLIEIPTDAAADRRRRARKEAQALCGLRHPSVVGGEGAGVTPEGSVFILMELLRGPSLRAVLDEHGKVNLVEALSLCAQIAEGVHAAHLLKIVHRDLKPENIIVEAGNRARVIDFGIAKFDAPDAETTQRALVLGTTHYMSPEHIQGMTVTPPSDIFALGTIFYELVAGIRPNLVGLEVIEPNTINYRLLHVPPTYLDLLVPGVSADLAEFVQKMLAKNPDERPESMAIVAQELRKFAASISADGARAVVRDLALVTAVDSRRWEHEHTTRRAEPLRADLAPPAIPDGVPPSQLAFPISSVVHAASSDENVSSAGAADSAIERGASASDRPTVPPPSRDAGASSSRVAKALPLASHPPLRVSRVDPAPDDEGSSKHTLRLGGAAPEHSPLPPAAGIGAASVAPMSSSNGASSARSRDSERRQATGPGYTREIAPPRTSKSPLAGVTSDPLWVRVVVAAIATGSITAIVLVSAFLNVYRGSNNGQLTSEARAPVGGDRHRVISQAASDPGIQHPDRMRAGTTEAVIAPDLKVEARASVSLPTPSVEAPPQAMPSASALKPTLVALAKPLSKHPQRSNAIKPAPSASSLMSAPLAPLRSSRPDPLVLPGDLAMPSSGLSDEPSKRPTTKEPAKRLASPAAAKAPPQDKDGRINLIFPPRQP